MGGAGQGSYSRTPELRVSHKMAERKRRSEMKSLFDELNAILPNSPGGKSSKWEILTKGTIDSHNGLAVFWANQNIAIEHIKMLKTADNHVRRDAERMRTDLDQARRTQEDCRALQQELSHAWTELQRIDPARPHVYGVFTQQLSEQARPPPSAHVSMLPPVQPAPQTNGQWSQTSSGAMQGVEYPGHYEHR